MIEATPPQQGVVLQHGYGLLLLDQSVQGLTTDLKSSQAVVGGTLPVIPLHGEARDEAGELWCFLLNLGHDDGFAVRVAVDGFELLDHLSDLC